LKKQRINKLLDITQAYLSISPTTAPSQVEPQMEKELRTLESDILPLFLFLAQKFLFKRNCPV
jgi:hypothetical protein